ncbi:hypothetical protein HU200_031804 [Digitaria exilis]|uniref:Uncharacterized protein n=1 Tax=Digitaria exilis TaxID=1010633 RepID=A0A835BPE7_9POAL|nr:hypothetical protein HU200_031804 [Digitaria exilis]
MTWEEKQEAASIRDGFPLCDFQEYIYGPKSHWPTQEQIDAFESSKERWPCQRTPRPRCKCGILARRGVVPSEMGYGWYCGNSYGDYWVSLSSLYEGRTCNWETFEDREQMMQGLARQAEPLRTRTTLEIKEEIRSKHGVPLPLDSNLYGPVCNDFYAKEDLIKYWRDNREKYDFPVTTHGKILEEEARRERMREEMLRRDWFKFDPLKVYPPGSWEEERQEYVAYWEGIDLRTVRIKAKLAQMEAMWALVRDLPGNMDSAERDKDMVRDDHLEMVRDLISDWENM